MLIEIFSYRFNFVMWRVRNVLQLLGMYFLWFALLTSGGNEFGYSQQLLLTYIIGTYFLQSIVFSTRTQMIGMDINQGDLSNYLMRPVNYFRYYMAKDIGDKSMNIFCSTIELSIFFYILRPPFFIQMNDLQVILFLLSIIIAVVIFFLLSSLMGFVGFWSQDIWSVRFIFGIIINFFAGGYFPLDLLPKNVFAIFQALPFQYLLYFPMKIYLGQLSFAEIWIGFVYSSFWVISLMFVTRLIWQKGLKSYSAYGR